MQLISSDSVGVERMQQTALPAMFDSYGVAFIYTIISYLQTFDSYGVGTAKTDSTLTGVLSGNQ